MKNLVLSVVLSIIPLQSLADSILIMGDSISAAYGISRESGWVSLLEAKLQQQYPDRFSVVNASISGETTAGGLFRLPVLLDEIKPDVVVIELGGNDGLRGMSLTDMKENLQRMVALVQQYGAATLLLSVNLPVSYGAYFNDRFKAVFQSVADSEQVGHVALGFDDLGDRNLLQDDGIHPTSEAQPLLLELIWPKLEAFLK